jgi:hypothetical protein
MSSNIAATLALLGSRTGASSVVLARTASRRICRACGPNRVEPGMRQSGLAHVFVVVDSARHPLSRLVVSLCLPVMLAAPGCDAGKSATDPAKTAPAKTDDEGAGKASAETKTDETKSDEAAPPAEKAEPGADGLDPSLDNSGLDDTGKAIAKLFDAAKTCAFDNDSQIRGCKPYDEFRAMQRAISPMTKEFAAQRDLVVLTRLQSKEPTVRAVSYNLGRGLYRSNPEARAAIEKALMAETDTIALLVGLRAVRDNLKANPSLKPVFDKHAASSDKDVAETAQEALDKAAQ